jgi:DNA-directed RNA polymerase I, II, and III subunit RPABC2
VACVHVVQPGEGGEDGQHADGEEHADILIDGEAGGSMEGRARTVAERITTRYLTKYERARVLGTRALQIR